jgi:uncharacterized protein YcbK (DUF882 family)
VPSQQLSPHFHLREFHCHDGTRVPMAARPALRWVCNHYLEPLREHFGACRVLSGYRTRPYNASVGGARFSQHIYEDGPESVATDVHFARGTPADWAAWAEQHLHPGGLGIYPGLGFIHIDNREGRARWTG